MAAWTGGCLGPRVPVTQTLGRVCRAEVVTTSFSSGSAHPAPPLRAPDLVNGPSDGNSRGGGKTDVRPLWPLWPLSVAGRGHDDQFSQEVTRTRGSGRLHPRRGHDGFAHSPAPSLVNGKEPRRTGKQTSPAAWESACPAVSPRGLAREKSGRRGLTPPFGT